MSRASDDTVADMLGNPGNIAGEILGFVKVGVLRTQDQGRNRNMAQSLPWRIGVLKVVGFPFATVAQGKAAIVLLD